MARNPWPGVVAVIVAIAVADCRSKPVPVEELFSTRMLGLSYLQRNQLPEAEIQFKKLIELAPNDPLGYTNLGLTYLQAGRFADAEKQLKRARELDPLNADIGLMLAKLYSLTGRPGEADSAVRQLEELRRIPPAPPAEARAYLDSAIQLLRAGKLAQALGPLDRLTHVLELTKPYQASLDEVKWTDGPVPGRPVLTFNPNDLVGLRGVRQRAAVDEVQLVDVTDNSGLVNPRRVADSRAVELPPGAPLAVATGDVDGDGIDDLFVSVWSAELRRSIPHLYRVRGGFVRDVINASGISLPDGAVYAAFADYDNDGWLDLFAIGPAGGRLFRNRGNGTFEDVTAKAGVGEVHGARKATFLDLDHDGDLD